MLSLEFLDELVEAHRASLRAPVAEFSLRGQKLSFNSAPHLMGVVNMSPGSWYRESVALSGEAAVERGRILRAQGADIVDLGAESTLAHTERVQAELQLKQLRPVVQTWAEENILVSVETYHPEVVRGCLQAGAAIINLTGTVATADIFRQVADADAAVILCYLESAQASTTVRDVTDFDLSSDPFPRMEEFFKRNLEEAQRAGLSKIILDPGLGFYYRNLQDSSVRVRHQIKVFLNTFRLRRLGFPVCHALPHAFEFFKEEVRSAEPFFAVLAALGKTDLFRTHEVSKVKAVLDCLKLMD